MLPAALRKQSFVYFDKEQTRQSIGMRFRGQVEQHGDWPAVESERRVITYAELDHLSNQVAHALLRRQRQTDKDSVSPVLLLFDHHASIIVAIFGALKAGIPYVPIDPNYPAVRIQKIVMDSGSDTVLTDTGRADSVPRMLGENLVTLNLDALPGGLSGDPVDLRVHFEQIAYLLYTSGSTGVPKGVVQTHRNVLSNIRNYTNDIHISQADRLSLITSFGFAASVSDLFGALLNGATVCLYDLHSRGIHSFPGWLVEKRITVCYSVPSVFRLWAAASESFRRFPDLRLIKLGGDRVRPSDVRLYRENFDDTCVLQVTLGATELNLVSRYWIDKQTKIADGVVPVGYPPDDVFLELVDDHGERVAAGQTGELVIRSPHLALGYWHGDAASDIRLFTDPEDPTRRVYHSGDLGRFLPDGCLVYLGRSDSRIKIRGQSVEITEVETVLSSLETVREAVVLNRPDNAGEARLVAYVVSGQREVTGSDLRTQLEAILPGFMIPDEIDLLEALPLNAHGKVDRDALLAYGRPVTAQSHVTDPPHTGIERSLCGLWTQILGQPEIGVRDRFQELGGHSLHAMRLVDAINERFNTTLSPRVLLEADTVRELAKVLECGGDVPAWSPLVRIRPSGSRPPLFMVHALDGHVLGYMSLARCLPTDQPVYGLEAQGLNGRQPPLTSVREMASLYLQAARQIQPQGPYRLGGFSFGGVIAYEMACQLSADREQVELLLIGDAWVLRGVHFKPLRYRVTGFTYWFATTPAQWLDVIRRRLGLRQATAPIRRGWGAPELHARMVRANKRATDHYAAGTYPGKVTLLRSQEYYRKVRRMQHYFGGAAMGWDRLAQGGVDIHLVPGRHFELFGAANAPRVAAIIAQTLSATCACPGKP